MSPSLERYPSSAKEASAALQINRTLGQHSDTENNGDDPQSIPTHTCSYCQRTFKSFWVDEDGNIIDSPMNAMRLRIELDNDCDVDEGARRGCEFYKQLQYVAKGDEVTVHIDPDRPTMLDIESSGRCEQFECYALNRYALNIGRPFHPKVLPNIHPTSASTVSFMRSVLKERLRLAVQPTVRIPPKRLLKLDASQHTVQLIETKINTIYSYATLSYCWGGDQEIMTTHMTVESHMSGILVDTLPRTIRDAVWVATVLGLQYLWVDVLCIIQDDRNDVAHEIAHQADVYRESTFTILAGDCASADDGFLHNRLMPVERFRISVRPPGTSDAGSWLVMKRDHPIGGNPIARRGWILQEFLLSPYVLHFSPVQLMIYCHDRIYANGGYKEFPFVSTGLRRSWHSGRINAASAADDWNTLVMCYSRMSVSKPSDKLAAISAAAEEMGGRFLEPHETHTSYRAGLWLQHMPKNLLWYQYHSSRLPRPSYRAPSWSWASIDNSVIFYQISRSKPYDNHITVVDCTTIPEFSSAPFGEVSGGELRLRGPLKTVFSYDIGNPYITVYDAEPNLKFLCNHDALEPELGKKSSGNEAEISLLLCASKKALSRHENADHAGLLLTRSSSEPIFRRIGLWRHYFTEEEETEWFDSFETTEVTII